MFLKYCSDRKFIPCSKEMYDEAKGKEWVKSWTNEASEDEYGETDIKSPKWLALRDNLTEVFNKAYMNTYMRNGQVVATEDQAYRAAQQAVKEAVGNPVQVQQMMNTDYTDGDETYGVLDYKETEDE